ncbi:conserved hypothetical protein, partial [Ixodes scapularis]
ECPRLSAPFFSPDCGNLLNFPRRAFLFNSPFSSLSDSPQDSSSSSDTSSKAWLSGSSSESRQGSKCLSNSSRMSRSSTDIFSRSSSPTKEPCSKVSQCPFWLSSRHLRLPRSLTPVLSSLIIVSHSESLASFHHNLLPYFLGASRRASSMINSANSSATSSNRDINSTSVFPLSVASCSKEGDGCS